MASGSREMEFNSLQQGDTSAFCTYSNSSNLGSRLIFLTRRARCTRRLGPSRLHQPLSPKADDLRTVGEDRRRGLPHLLGSRQFAAHDPLTATLRQQIGIAGSSSWFGGSGSAFRTDSTNNNRRHRCGSLSALPFIRCANQWLRLHPRQDFAAGQRLAQIGQPLCGDFRVDE